MAKGRKRGKRREKQPATAISPSDEKRPFAGAPERRHSGQYVAWRFSQIDSDGAWSWFSLEGDKYREVVGKLARYEKKRLEQVQGNGVGKAKRIPITGFPAPTIGRLRHLGHDDVDELWELRVTGAERVWCFRIENVLYLLWWDPKHQVCPSKRKHT